MGTQKIVKQQQLQQLAKHEFIPEKSKFRRTKRSLFNEETWSGNFIDKSTLCSFNWNFKHILAVRDSFRKYAWQILIKLIN